MANLNDNKIIELKKQVSKKRDEINSLNKKFIPNTNCVLDINNTKYNLNVLRKSDLILLAIDLKVKDIAADSLDFIDKEELLISGFKINDWLDDIKLKLEVIKYNEEKKKLDIMENKLTRLLSEKKKVELEIEEIAFMLN